MDNSVRHDSFRENSAELMNRSPFSGLLMLKNIISLLSRDKKTKFELENEKLVRELGGGSYRPDIFLPDGWEKLGVAGRTIVELKVRLLPNAIARYSRLFEELRRENKIDNFIIVFLESEFGNEKIYEKRKQGFKVLSYDSLFANDEVALCEEESSEAKNESLIRRAHDAFYKGNVVVFLGAGVSASAGLPSWEELLKEIMTSQLDMPGNDFDFIAKQCFNSSIISARYIKRLLGEKQKTNNCANEELDEIFCNVIKDILYGNKNYKNIPQEGSLIRRIGEMISIGRGTKNLVESIITYNYDTLIEDELFRRKVNCFSIGCEDRWLAEDLPVYHVHGVLYPPDSRMASLKTKITLSEEEYHHSYKEVYNWATIEQLHAMRYKTCFFIGLSMSDPSLRRLLDLSKDTIGDNLPHYVFLQNKTISDFYSDKNQTILEEMMNSFGVNVIWYKEHSELPSLINRIISDNAATVCDKSARQKNIRYFTASGVDAIGRIEENGGMTVLAGSKICAETKKNCPPSISEQRKNVAKDFLTKEDVYFESPTAAASFVSGGLTGGQRRWVETKK